MSPPAPPAPRSPSDFALSDFALSDFDYALPESLIAQQPPARRTDARLLFVQGLDRFSDLSIRDLPSLLDPGDLIVVNDTRVIRARLIGHKSTGGRVEVFIERLLSDTEALAMLRASHRPKPGAEILFDGASARVVDPSAQGASAQGASAQGASALDPSSPDASPARIAGGERSRMVRLRFSEALLPLLERIGAVPLPPYIDRSAGPQDAERYQTIFAREPGAVAAPTAGLHFDEELLAAVRARGVEIANVTLHVGAGTFLPVAHEDLDRHLMHAERWSVPPETAERIARTHARGGSVIAIGTTALRALEASEGRPGCGETDLFIRPGYRFKVVDRLLTNFHLPKSTLLMLVSALAGIDTIRAAYAHAIARHYRFFSYGDAMLLSLDGQRTR